MTALTDPQAGIYVHIPYCHSKCAYCDFYSTPARTGVKDFADALLREFRSRSHEIDGHRVATVYLGGGTPSSLSEDQIENILSFLPVNEASEITIEVNPEDISERMASFIAGSPITRVSMGVQTLDDTELKFIGRRHTAADAVSAYERLRKSGIGNISLDLIFGLPGQSVASWEKTLDRTLALNPDHLSAYTLMLEEGTRLTAMMKSGKFTETPDSDIERMYNHLCRQAADNGFGHYEISNFARNGFESVHNSSYWNFTPYLGLGPGAHSFDGKIRRFNPPSLKKYLAKPECATVAEEESLNERINDYIMVRLRTAAGLDLTDLTSRFGSSVTQQVEKSARPHLTAGRLSRSIDTIRIPENRFLTSDPIIADMMID